MKNIILYIWFYTQKTCWKCQLYIRLLEHLTPKSHSWLRLKTRLLMDCRTKTTPQIRNEAVTRSASRDGEACRRFAVSWSTAGTYLLNILYDPSSSDPLSHRRPSNGQLFLSPLFPFSSKYSDLFPLGPPSIRQFTQCQHHLPQDLLFNSVIWIEHRYLLFRTICMRTAVSIRPQQG